MRARPLTARVATAVAALALAASGLVGSAAVSGAATPTPAQQVLTLVNAQRAKAGCRALRVDLRLQRAALAHSVDMAKRRYFSHTSLDGRTFVDRIRAQGYPGRRLGENIAAGYRTPSAVMTAWMKSPGHRANILDCRYTAIGIGVTTGGPYGVYWTQDFGG